MKQHLWKLVVAMVAVVGVAALVVPSQVSAAKRRAPKKVHFQEFDSASASGVLNIGEAPGKTSLALAEASFSASGPTGDANGTLQVFVIDGSTCPDDYSGIPILGTNVLRTMNIQTDTTTQLEFSPNLSVAAPGSGKIACLVVDAVGEVGGFVDAGASGFQIVPR